MRLGEVRSLLNIIRSIEATHHECRVRGELQRQRLILGVGIGCPSGGNTIDLATWTSLVSCKLTSGIASYARLAGGGNKM